MEGVSPVIDAGTNYALYSGDDACVSPSLHAGFLSANSACLYRAVKTAVMVVLECSLCIGSSRRDAIGRAGRRTLGVLPASHGDMYITTAVLRKLPSAGTSAEMSSFRHSSPSATNPVFLFFETLTIDFPPVPRVFRAPCVRDYVLLSQG